jgi:hypothetical protein|uniref:hypothetical protein n=1 Tax=Prosthecobacter sp. TaxID=1965333 RepID=UPI003782EF04
MQTTKHSRESAVKGDDQIAFENATALEEACSYQKALDWYAEVKPTGGYWDMSASAGRVAILTALHRLPEAVQIGTEAVRRMQTPDAELVNELARALNLHRGPEDALALCRRALRLEALSQNPNLWYSASAYASQCGQLGRSLRYLARSLHCSGGVPITDLLLDRDFAPLWHHLENEPLSGEEAEALRQPFWQKCRHLILEDRGHPSFESYAHVPAALRAYLRLNTRSMNWHLHRDTPAKKAAGFETWCEAVRTASMQSLDAGLRKALAQAPATSAECA